MENEDFIKFRDDLAKTMRQNENLCREGYLDVMRSKDINALLAVVKKHWAELNRTLWKEFQICLRTHYDGCKEQVNAHGIYYNETCDHGVCCIDKHAPRFDMNFFGRADVVVHDNANVRMFDQSHATLLDAATAEAHNNSSVDARHNSKVSAFDFARIRAFDKAFVSSFGSTEIYLYGTSTLEKTRARKVEVGVGAKVIVHGEL